MRLDDDRHRAPVMRGVVHEGQALARHGVAARRDPQRGGGHAPYEAEGRNEPEIRTAFRFLRSSARREPWRTRCPCPARHAAPPMGIREERDTWPKTSAVIAAAF